MKRLVAPCVTRRCDPGSTPASAEILRFWSWNAGSWTVTFQFECIVSITTAVDPFQGGKDVRGEVTLHSAVAASERSFRNTTTKGLADFSENVRAELAGGGGSPSR